MTGSGWGGNGWAGNGLAGNGWNGNGWNSNGWGNNGWGGGWNGGGWGWNGGGWGGNGGSWGWGGYWPWGLGLSVVGGYPCEYGYYPDVSNYYYYPYPQASSDGYYGSATPTDYGVYDNPYLPIDGGGPNDLAESVGTAPQQVPTSSAPAAVPPDDQLESSAALEDYSEALRGLPQRRLSQRPAAGRPCRPGSARIPRPTN